MAFAERFREKSGTGGGGCVTEEPPPHPAHPEALASASCSHGRRVRRRRTTRLHKSSARNAENQVENSYEVETCQADKYSLEEISDCKTRERADFVGALSGR